jgi:YHS domain-containing protein
MFRFVLYAVLILLVARAIWRLVSGVLEGAGLNQRAIPPAVKLVRDPVCGMFVAPSNALVVGTGAEAKYFCSEKCRREWMK